MIGLCAQKSWNHHHPTQATIATKNNNNTQFKRNEVNSIRISILMLVCTQQYAIRFASLRAAPKPLP